MSRKFEPILGAVSILMTNTYQSPNNNSSLWVHARLQDKPIEKEYKFARNGTYLYKNNACYSKWDLPLYATFGR